MFKCICRFSKRKIFDILLLQNNIQRFANEVLISASPQWEMSKSTETEKNCKWAASMETKSVVHKQKLEATQADCS